MPDTVSIRTVISDQGDSLVTLQVDTFRLALTPEASIETGLNLISAAYAARGEQAIRNYSKQHALNTEELLRALRDSGNGK